MRMLLTGDTAGGVFTFVKELAAALQSKNCEVTLATFGPQPATPPSHLRWFHHCSKLEWQPDPWQDLEQAGEWLKRLVDRENPDLLHFNTLCHGDNNWSRPLLTTIHSCVPTWWQAVKKSPLPVEWNRYRQVVQQSLNAASLLIYPSHALANAFQMAWDMTHAETCVIPNGIDGSRFFTEEKQPLILAVGRFWDEAKDARALDRMAGNSPWPIYLAGESCDATSCKLLGQLSPSEIRAWYARASIFIAPTIYEPFGLAVLEAAASGCALLLNDIPAFRENWSGAAVFCRPDSLGSCLDELIGNQDLRSHLQRQALLRSRRFNQSHMASSYMQRYERSMGLACAS
jgi:glycogen(starch) synthase